MRLFAACSSPEYALSEAFLNAGHVARALAFRFLLVAIKAYMEPASTYGECRSFQTTSCSHWGHRLAAYDFRAKTIYSKSTFNVYTFVNSVNESRMTGLHGRGPDCQAVASLSRHRNRLLKPSGLGRPPHTERCIHDQQRRRKGQISVLLMA